MNDMPTTYQAFLLRLRRADNAGRPVWRISLERPGQAGLLHFDSLSALCTYLRTQIQLAGEKGDDQDETELI